MNDITVSGGDYEHTLGVHGYSDRGIRVRYETLPVREIFHGMLEARRFEVCEFSLANYLILRGTGQHWLTALPVFPYRAFRHGFAITRRDSALNGLDALGGKRIGVDDYSMTAAVWFRGILRDHYGVDPQSITWVTHAKQRFEIPANARVEQTADDLEDLLTNGNLDALLGFNLRDNRLPARERRLRTVLVDPEAEERAYFEHTGIYPIMHGVVVRNDVLEKNANVADVVAAAYASAKARAYQRQLGATLVPWGKSYWQRTFERFGGDPLPYGWTPENRRNVGTLAGYLHQQGFIPAVPDIESLFASIRR